MKKVSLLLACSLLFLSPAAYADDASGSFKFKTGTYALRGSNDGSNNTTYEGDVIIKEQGDNYDVTWKIGRNRNQVQTGVGILKGNVLSVAYYDVSGGSFGVVSFLLTAENTLTGKWSPIHGTKSGKEFLTWVSDLTQ